MRIISATSFLPNSTFLFPSAWPPLPSKALLSATEPPTRKTHSKLLKMICFDPSQTHEQVRSLQVVQQRGTKTNKYVQKQNWRSTHRPKQSKSCFLTLLAFQVLDQESHKTTNLSAVCYTLPYILLCMYTFISLLVWVVMFFFFLLLFCYVVYCITAEVVVRLTLWFNIFPSLDSGQGYLTVCSSQTLLRHILYNYWITYT